MEVVCEFIAVPGPNKLLSRESVEAHDDNCAVFWKKT